MTEKPDPAGMDALSFGQQRMWFLNRLEGRVATYSLPYALRLSGDLDVPALRAALADLIGRHEILRVVYPELDGLPAPRVLAPELACPGPPVIAVTEAELPGRLAAGVAWGFDIRNEPPVRAELYRLAPDTHVLLLVIHHIATDEWSNGVLARDLRTAYEARLRGTSPDWPPLTARYADHAVRQRELATEENLAYWREALAGLPDELDLPADRPRPTVGSYRGGSVPLHLDAGLHQGLLELARTARVSPFMVLQAGLAALLTRLGAGTDIPIGTPIAGRGDPAYDDVVGYFVNSLVLRTDTGGDPAFSELLRRVRDRDLAAYAHQDTPFEQLVEDLAPPRSLARNPLFQTMLTLLPADVPWELPGLDITHEPISTGASPVDLAFTLWQRQDAEGRPAGLSGALDYSADLFDAPTATALAERLVRLLAHVVADPGSRCGQVDVLTPSERRSLAAWNDTARPVPEASLGGLVTAQAVRSGDAVAVVFEDSSWTYAELDAAANRVAHRLIEAGVGPECVVGVYAERSLELIAGLLGVLKAGAAYLPLDTDHPAGRTAFMLTDSGTRVVLTQRRFAGRLPAGVDVLALDDPGVWAGLPDGDPKPVVHPDSAAYLMYTSGSTGRPKGVLVPHRAIVSQLTWLGERFPLRPDDRYLHHMSTSFDVSLMELFLPLTTGAGLVLARPGGHRDLAYLAGLVREQRVTIVGLVPTALAELLRFLQDAGAMASIRTLRRHFTGGEALTGEFAARWRAHTGVPLYHFYGPTEATVQVTCWGQDEDPEVPAGARVPIGPLAGNVRARVLDERLREVPVATPGAAVRRRRAGRPRVPRPARPDRAALRRRPVRRARRPHVRDRRPRPVEPGRPAGVPRPDRRPGQGPRLPDRARRDRDRAPRAPGRPRLRRRGQGRPPRRVRGRRGGHRGAARDAGAAAARLHDPGDVRRAARAAALAEREAGPAALPAPDFAARSTAAERRPATPAEDLFRRLFAEVLGLEGVGATDNFFDLGGDSIISLHLVSSARRAGLRISTRDVFQRKTPAGLAAVAEATGAAGPAGEESGVGELPLTPVMRWFDERGMLAGRYAQSVVVPVPAGLDGARLTAGLQAVLDRHDMLRGRLVDGPCLEVREAGAVAAGGCVRRVDAAGLDAGALRRTLAEAGRAALDRLDPRAGEMVRAVWLDPGPGQPGHLLLVVHHLAVDGVSWRILVPDLAAAWQAIAEGRAPELGAGGHVLRPLGPAAGRAGRRTRQELPLLDAACWTGRTPAGPAGRSTRRGTPWRDRAGPRSTLPPERDRAAADTACRPPTAPASTTCSWPAWRSRWPAGAAPEVSGTPPCSSTWRGTAARPLDRRRRPVAYGRLVHRRAPGPARPRRGRPHRGARGRPRRRPGDQSGSRSSCARAARRARLRPAPPPQPGTATELAAYAAPQIAFNYLGRFDTADADRDGGPGRGLGRRAAADAHPGGHRAGPRRRTAGPASSSHSPGCRGRSTSRTWRTWPRSGWPRWTASARTPPTSTRAASRPPTCRWSP